MIPSLKSIRVIDAAIATITRGICPEIVVGIVAASATKKIAGTTIEADITNLADVITKRSQARRLDEAIKVLFGQYQMCFGQ